MDSQSKANFYEEHYDDCLDCIDTFFRGLSAGERFTIEDMSTSLNSLEVKFPQSFLHNWIKEEVIKSLGEQKRVKYVFRGSYVKVK